MLLEHGPTPLYYQLEQILKERIQRREFAPGELLPTEEALCEAYGVSRATVRRAFELLDCATHHQPSARCRYISCRRIEHHEVDATHGLA